MWGWCFHKDEFFFIFQVEIKIVEGTNTRGEIALWSLFFFADSKIFHQMQILGDSKVIVDWFNHEAQLQGETLQGWIQKICMLAMDFSFLSLSHIYREYNSVVNKLPKESLLLHEGRLVGEEFGVFLEDDSNVLYAIMFSYILI
jgi:hypothetical protein